MEFYKDFGNGKFDQFDDAFDQFAEKNQGINKQINSLKTANEELRLKQRGGGEFPDWSDQKPNGNVDFDDLFPTSPLKVEEIPKEAQSSMKKNLAVTTAAQAPQEKSVEENDKKIDEDFFDDLPSLDKQSDTSMKNSMELLIDSERKKDAGELKEGVGATSNSDNLLDWVKGAYAPNAQPEQK